MFAERGLRLSNENLDDAQLSQDCQRLHQRLPQAPEVSESVGADRGRPDQRLTQGDQRSTSRKWRRRRGKLMSPL